MQNKIETLARALAANSSNMMLLLAFPQSYETFPDRRIIAGATVINDEGDDEVWLDSEPFSMDEYRQALVLAAREYPLASTENVMGEKQ